MRAGALVGVVLWSCSGGGGEAPAGLATPGGVLPADQPWIEGGPGLALTEAAGAEAAPVVPLVISDAALSADAPAWRFTRPGDAPAGVAITATGRKPRPAVAVEIDHPVSGRNPLEIRVELRTDGLRPAPTGGGAALVVEQLDKDGERVDLHDGNQRLSGDTPWRAQTVRLTPRSKTRSLRIRLQPGVGSVTGEAAFRELGIRTVPMEEQIGPAIAGQHARAHEAKLGRITRPALLTRTGEHWTADVPAAGGVLELGFARPKRGLEGEVCLHADVAGQGSELSCLGRDDGGAWSSVSLPVPAGEGPRRVRLSLTGPPGAVGLLGDPVVRSGAAVAAGKPDLALIVLDTLRADHLGVQGYTARPTSPNIDAFAGRALRYAQARSTSGWTATSLGTVVTGLMPSVHRAGSRRERAHSPASMRMSASHRHQLTFRGLRADRPILPELLRREGYRTVAWVDNPFFSSPYGFARGFSHHDRYSGDDLLGVAEGVDKALAFLEGLPPRSERAPYLLVLHAIDPHAPYHAREPAEPGFELPESLVHEVERVEAPTQSAWVVNDIWQTGRVDAEAMQVPYDSEIQYMDRQLGPLLQRLEADGAGVVLLSDHGEEFADHGAFSHGRTLYEELLAVPLVVRAPGASPRVGVVDAPASLDGVAATMLGFAGLSAPPGAAPPLPTDAADAAGRTLVAEGAYRGEDLTGVRMGDLKAVLRHAPGLRSQRLRTAAKAWARGEMTGELAIYDLATDPGETRDVGSGLEPAVRDPLMGALHRQLSRAETGVHLRCTGEGPEVVLTADEPISRFVPFAWGPDHAGAIDAARRTFSMTPAADGVAWGVVRFTAEPRSLSVLVDGAGVAADVSADADFPTALPGTACVAWRVSAEGANAALDAEELANLEALGYMGD